MSIDPNLPKLVLEGESLDDLKELSYNAILEASNGTITDFRAGSVTAALVEGQVFAISELLYYVNLLPEAISLELFRLYGVTRSLGTKAKGNLTFLLLNPQSTPFTLPVGYQIPFANSYLELTSVLYIPPGAISAKADVEMAVVGYRYNVASYSVSATGTGLGNLQSIYNEEPLSGGSDIEDIATTITRGQAAINSRKALINAADYEATVRELLGEGSRAICVPRLSSDKSTLAYGNIGVFILDSKGRAANSTLLADVKEQLADRLIIGTQLWTFPMELIPVTVAIYIQVDNINVTIADRVNDVIQTYLKPSLFPTSYKVRYNEIAFRARAVPGCTSVESVILNGDAMDLLLPNTYTLPSVTLVTVNQVSKLGDVLETSYYSGLEEVEQ